MKKTNQKRSNNIKFKTRIYKVVKSWFGFEWKFEKGEDITLKGLNEFIFNHQYNDIIELKWISENKVEILFENGKRFVAWRKDENGLLD